MLKYTKVRNKEKEDAMNVTQYLFKSPSPNQIQVGRLAPNVSGEKNTQSNTSEMANLSQNSEQNPLQTQEAKTTVKSDNLLDIYV